MPDVAPVIMHESAFHMPNCGIASIGANIDEGHEVFIVDLIRKRRQLRKYITRTLQKIRPHLVGLSSMAWQYQTCIKLIRLIKQVLPEVKIVIGGYHATLMHEEIAASPEAESIDFMIRGEGEEACRRLVNALAGKDRLEDIASLSYKANQHFVHNPQGELLDLSGLKFPLRDKRRLTWGYHIMSAKVEVMETSRGCTRTCNYCSIRHMYGRAFRTFPIERVLADLDDIYYKRKTRWAFVADDNLVLDPQRVIEICDAIIARQYKNLHLVVQADCPVGLIPIVIFVAIGDILLKAIALDLGRCDKDRQFIRHRPGSQALDDPVIVIPNLSDDLATPLLGIRFGADKIHRTTDGVAPVQGALGAAQHLNPVNVEEV